MSFYIRRDQTTLATCNRFPSSLSSMQRNEDATKFDSIFNGRVAVSRHRRAVFTTTHAHRTIWRCCCYCCGGGLRLSLPQVVMGQLTVHSTSGSAGSTRGRDVVTQKRKRRSSDPGHKTLLPAGSEVDPAGHAPNEILITKM